MIEVNKEQLLTLEQAAEILGVTKLTVWTWTKRTTRPLETVKIGGLRRTSREALQRFAQQDDASTSAAVGAVIGSSHGSDYESAMGTLRRNHGLKD